MADKLSSGLFISEILADNAGGTAIDTDGDGGANKADEFVEIQNTSNVTQSLDGIEIWSQQNGLLHQFGPGDTVAPGQTATVLGEYTGPPPAGFFGAETPSGTNNNGINFLQDGEGNKFDTIFLVDTNTGEYTTLTYGAPPRPIVLPSGFTGTTQVGSGETIASSAPNGRAFARDATGTLIETDPTPGVADPVCFAEGTLVRMADGTERAVEALAPGDLVWTEAPHGARLSCVARSPGDGRGPRAPVTIAAGVFGNRASVRVSAQHRILITGPEAEVMFGTDRLLVPAVHLVGMPGVTRSEVDAVTYYHLIFDGHRVVDTCGMLSESFYPGAQGLAHLDRATAREAAALFGDLTETPLPSLAPTLKAHEGRMLAGALARRMVTSR